MAGLGQAEATKTQGKITNNHGEYMVEWLMNVDNSSILELLVISCSSQIIDKEYMVEWLITRSHGYHCRDVTNNI